MQERIQKVLATAGVASRRAVEEMIQQGLIKINGKLAELGAHIDPDKDLVTVNGKRVTLSSEDIYEKVYFVLNKPAGMLSTTKDDRERPTVMDLVAGATDGRIYPVGRLDYDAEGLIMLTNDGDLTNKLIHPKRKVPKVYMVKVKGTPTEESLNKLRRGIYLEDGPTGPCEIRVVRKARVNTWVEVILTQGKNRQIKRMFWRFQNPVMRIVRTHFAGLSLEGLDVGKYRSLTKRELADLKKTVSS